MPVRYVKLASTTNYQSSEPSLTDVQPTVKSIKISQCVAAKKKLDAAQKAFDKCVANKTKMKMQKA